MDTNERLIRAVQLAAAKLVSNADIDQLLDEVLAICVEAVGASGGTIYLHDDRSRRLVFHSVRPAEVRTKLPVQDIPDDYGVAGKVFHTRRSEISEFPEVPTASRTDFESATGVYLKTMLTSPLMMEGEIPIGVVQLINKKEGSFTDTDVAVLETVAAVCTMAVINSQLADEASRASTLLGMGKVSHDIGNLAAALFANISYAGMAVEAIQTSLSSQESELDGKRLADLSANLGGSLDDLKGVADRIVGYARLISDLSAGRPLRPNRTRGSLSAIIEAAAREVEGDCEQSGACLSLDLQEGAPETCIDSQYMARIVQNLLGNSIKAIGEAPLDPGASGKKAKGIVRVEYRFKRGRHILTVADNGPGMTREQVRAVLSGAGRSYWSKSSGSGWGIRIVLELAATHEGKVDVESEPGKGATFRLSFPHVDPETDCP
ncbi:MAG: ATP-binding protein [Fimbriimonadaceae bacterium]|nr:ATP-binding protein [Fimbriimonadaceae bacterium]NUM37990.1 GAF domain-containing protein [Armatimonadota bacterium]